MSLLQETDERRRWWYQHGEQPLSSFIIPSGLVQRRRPRSADFIPAVSSGQPSSSTAANLFSQPTARYFSILSQANTPILSSRRPLRTGRGSGMVSTLFSGNRPSSPSSDTSAFVDEYESDEPLRPTGSSKRSRSGRHREREDADGASTGADGYYDRFFKEEGRLGMGAQGTVFLWCVI